MKKIILLSIGILSSLVLSEGIANAQAEKKCELKPHHISFINQPFDTITNQTVTLKIATKDVCTSVPLQVHIMARTSLPGDTYAIDLDPEIDGKDYISLTAVEGKDVTIYYQAHDDDCYVTNDSIPNCMIYVEVKDKDGNMIATTKPVIDSSFSAFSSEVAASFKQTSNFIKGAFIAQCSGIYCGSGDWKLKSVSGTTGQTGSALDVIPQGTYDTASPCFDSKTGTYKSECYELLATIPGIGTEYTDGDGTIRKTGFEVDEATGRQTVDTKKIQLGDYINQIFRIALGILMVLAVIMTIIAGVEYMTVESVFGKSAAKSRIVNALTGLLIGLGIFLILSTINPKLLEVNFSPEEVSIDFTQIDAEQMKFIQDTDISGIPDANINSILSYEPLIAYLYHQQGPAGAPSTIWAAKKGLQYVPSSTPFLKNAKSIQPNINAQYGKYMSPTDFVKRFYKVLKSKEQKIGTIPQAHAVAIEKAAKETGVDANVLKTVCMIESYDCTKATIVNKYGYTGLFQFHPTRSWPDWRKNSSSNIKDPYDNAYAGAKFMKYNINKYKSDKLKMN